MSKKHAHTSSHHTGAITIWRASQTFLLPFVSPWTCSSYPWTWVFLADCPQSFGLAWNVFVVFSQHYPQQGDKFALLVKPPCVGMVLIALDQDLWRLAISYGVWWFVKACCSCYIF